MYKEKQIELDKHIAGLLLSAIVSDSLLLKSPTCTEEDVKAAQELAEKAGVDLEEYGLEMLKAGADISDKTVKELITMDAKEFAMGDAKVEIAQVNAVDVSEIYQLHDELVSEITATVNEKGLDLFLFVATDILNNDSEVLAVGPEKANVEKAFHATLDENDRALLKGVVSRKKQIVTALTEQF